MKKAQRKKYLLKNISGAKDRIKCYNELRIIIHRYEGINYDGRKSRFLNG